MSREEPLNEKSIQDKGAVSDAENSRGVYWPLPYLLAIVVPLAIVAANPDDIPPLPSLLRTIGRLLAGVFVFHMACKLLRFRSPTAEMLTCLGQVHLVAYGIVHKVALGQSVQHRLLLPVWTIAIGAFAWWCWKGKAAAVRKVASALQLGLFVLLAMQCFQLGPALFRSPSNTNNGAPKAIELTNIPSADTLPDIYYIILDAYGRADRLQEFYQYDNAPFLDALAERGFWIGAKARCNYHYTRLSLPSSLNTRHLHEEDPKLFATRAYAHQLINQGEVIKTLNQAGYQTVALADGFQPIEDSVFDRYLTESYAASELDSALLGSTWVLPLLEATRRTSPFDSARNRLLRRFEVLGKLGDEATGPMFVFAHILAPHRPFLFDANGRHLGPPESFWDGASYSDPTPETREMYKRGYVGQLQYINQQVLATIDTIRRQGRPALIILQGDHGPCAFLNDLPNEDAYLRERVPILMAIHSPDGVDLETYDTLSPVNLFRVVFNSVLKTELPLLEDRSYYKADRTAKTFRDVTQEVDEIATTDKNKD